MRISAGCEYAIHSMLYLAMNKGDTPVDLGEVAAAQGLSESYLAKIFTSLARSGLLVSYRGAGGGYMLNGDLETISLKDIVIAMEGNESLLREKKSPHQCDWGLNCSIRVAFETAKDKMMDELARVNLKELAKTAHKRGFPSWAVQRLKRDQEHHGQ